MASASGLTSITLFIAGPCLSISSMRARYFSVIERALNFPEAIPACRSAMVISSNSNGSDLGYRCAGKSCPHERPPKLVTRRR